jgi:hypothetical protein
VFDTSLLDPAVPIHRAQVPAIHPPATRADLCVTHGPGSHSADGYWGRAKIAPSTTGFISTLVMVNVVVRPAEVLTRLLAIKTPS